MSPLPQACVDDAGRDHPDQGERDPGRGLSLGDPVPKSPQALWGLSRQGPGSGGPQVTLQVEAPSDKTQGPGGRVELCRD